MCTRVGYSSYLEKLTLGFYIHVHVAGPSNWILAGHGHFVTLKMSTARAKVAVARRQRGVSRDSLSGLEWKISLIEKETLSSTDHIALQRLAKKIESLDEEFKNQHFILVELLDQEDDLTKEQAALNEHDDQVADLSDRAEQLRLLVMEPTCSLERTPTTSHAGELVKRLKYMEDKLAFVMEEVRPLVPGPTLNSCLVHQLHK